MNLAEDDMSEMKLKSVACTTIVAALLLAGCDRRKDEPPPPPEPQSAPAADAATKTADESHLPPGIDWFSGDVDAAFAAARKADKPVFLYWGAEWCPPCAQIKTTIFSKREFQQRSRLFVPVYLDGDTPSAQKYGERFGVIGYPTMILFKPDGTEITRLPGGVDVARYARILDVALADARPVSDILAAARSGDAVTSNDWKLLAYYSWSTDAGHVLPADQQLATFRALAQRCPAELPAECARFFFAYLGAAATASNPASRPSTGSSVPTLAADCWRCCRRPRSRRPTSTTCSTARRMRSVCCRVTARLNAPNSLAPGAMPSINSAAKPSRCRRQRNCCAFARG